MAHVPGYGLCGQPPPCPLARKPTKPKKPKTPRYTQKDAVWFRDRMSILLEERDALRKAVDAYCADLERGGLSGRLLAKELRERIAKVSKR